jgi:hypothetical protein
MPCAARTPASFSAFVNEAALRGPRDGFAGFTAYFTKQLCDTLSSTGGVNFFRIDELRVPPVIPLIQAEVNDVRVFWFLLGGIVKSVTLTAGNYSGTDLATLLHDASSNTAPEDTWAVTYNNHLASLSVFCTDQTFLALTDTAVAAAGHSLPTFASILFQNAYSYNTGAGSITWSYCSVVAVDMMHLSSNKLASQVTFGPDGATDTMMAAVMEGDFASVLNASMSSGIWWGMPSLTTSTLDFQLRDRSCNELQNIPSTSFNDDPLSF